jgi:hypothetical protein
MSTKVIVEFSTREFEFSHGALPRGRGSWAFEVFGGKPVFFPSSTYAEAKRACAKRVKEACAIFGYHGHVLVTVCS